MSELTTTSRSGVGTSRLVGAFAVLMSLSLLIAACGTNNQSGAPGGSAAAGASAAASAAQAPAVSAAASVGGTLTVWAMGNEGVKLKDLADKFMAANPGTTVNVT